MAAELRAGNKLGNSGTGMTSPCCAENSIIRMGGCEDPPSATPLDLSMLLLALGCAWVAHPLGDLSNRSCWNSESLPEAFAVYSR